MGAVSSLLECMILSCFLAHHVAFSTSNFYLKCFFPFVYLFACCLELCGVKLDGIDYVFMFVCLFVFICVFVCVCICVCLFCVCLAVCGVKLGWSGLWVGGVS